MSRFADIRVEWRVEEIERNLQRKADQHEISTLSGDVGRLECSLRETRAEVDGLRRELQALQDQVMQLLQGANHDDQTQ
jgi:predicted RNase H-like nuclease (RuvC/YqgF family)